MNIAYNKSDAHQVQVLPQNPLLLPVPRQLITTRVSKTPTSRVPMEENKETSHQTENDEESDENLQTMKRSAKKQVQNNLKKRRFVTKFGIIRKYDGIFDDEHPRKKSSKKAVTVIVPAQKKCKPLPLRKSWIKSKKRYKKMARVISTQHRRIKRLKKVYDEKIIGPLNAEVKILKERLKILKRNLINLDLILNKLELDRRCPCYLSRKLKAVII